MAWSGRANRHISKPQLVRANKLRGLLLARGSEAAFSDYVLLSARASMPTGKSFLAWPHAADAEPGTKAEGLDYSTLSPA